MSGPPFASLPDALAWLDAHINYEQAAPTRQDHPTLKPMRELVHVMGDPQQAYPAIHVTGTNGKGSTAAMATALLAARGVSTGTYTSPNLTRVNERLSRDGRPIGDEAFCELLSWLAGLEPLLTSRPTRFELLTAAALAWFADSAVGAAVIEVGLGGTWDCTNVVDGAVAVVTSIGLDHTEVLGPTQEAIAGDKAGIIKAGSRAVIGDMEPAIADLLAERAYAAGAVEVWRYGADFECSVDRVAVGGRLVDLRTPGGTVREVLVPLHGAHQARNAACALAAVEAFFGAPVPEGLVDQAFAAVRVPGRLEVVGRQPLTLVDGAHNVAGMEALGRALTEEFQVDGPSVAVVGMLARPDARAMLAQLVRAGVTTVVACAPTSRRALSAEAVTDAARGAGVGTAVTEATVADAVARGRSLAGADGLCVVAGSLYVAAEARQLLAVSE